MLLRDFGSIPRWTFIAGAATGAVSALASCGGDRGGRKTATAATATDAVD